MDNSIIFLGDSLTECGNWDKLFPNSTIHNYGVSGEKTYDILERLEKIFKYNPSKIFLMMGINDLGENQSIQDITENYREVVTLISQKLSNSQLYILSLLPVDFNRWGNTGLSSVHIKLLNELIGEIAHHHKATFINMYPAFSDSNEYLNTKLTSDGLHLNSDGYEVWKKQIESYI